jgi:hypothetical protein
VNITTLQAVAGGASVTLVLVIIAILRLVLNHVVLTVEPKPKLTANNPERLLEVEETRSLPEKVAEPELDS